MSCERGTVHHLCVYNNDNNNNPALNLTTNRRFEQQCIRSYNHYLFNIYRYTITYMYFFDILLLLTQIICQNCTALHRQQNHVGDKFAHSNVARFFSLKSVERTNKQGATTTIYYIITVLGVLYFLPIQVSAQQVEVGKL